VVGGQGFLVKLTAHPVTVASAAKVAVATTGERPGRTSHLPPGWSPDRPAADPRDDQHRGTPTRNVHLVTSEPTARGPAHRSGTSGSGAAGSAGASQLASVVVHRGDTLWDIAARHLGPGANNAQVAADWPRWHAANRSTIGPDPNLIVPGQRLRIPDQQPHNEHASTNGKESP